MGKGIFVKKNATSVSIYEYNEDILKLLYSG